jgi:hypothetical protein
MNEYADRIIYESELYKLLEYVLCGMNSHSSISKTV